MKYAVQFAEPRFFGVVEVTVDTGAITYKEAMKLYIECRERFIKAFNNKDDAHLVVWEDVGEGKFPNYHKELVELDTRDNLKYVHGTFYKTKSEEVTEPTSV